MTKEEHDAHERIEINCCYKNTELDYDNLYYERTTIPDR